MFEDCSSWKEIPSLEEFPPNTMHITFMNEKVQKLPCPNYLLLEGEETAWNLNTKLSLLGAFPVGGLGLVEKPTLALFEAFRAFDLSKFKFKDYTAGYVKANNNAIKCAVYFNEEMILVVVANVERNPVKNFKWTINLESISWSSSQKYHLTSNLGDFITVVEGRDLVNNGVEDSLNGSRFKVYVIRKYQPDKKYVLYNTRAWSEKYENEKLVVETKGPVGQGATLKFYSSKKPEEVKINSKLLAQNEWFWDEANKIGTIEYVYEKTGETISIQIV